MIKVLKVKMGRHEDIDKTLLTIKSYEESVKLWGFAYISPTKKK